MPDPFAHITPDLGLPPQSFVCRTCGEKKPAGAFHKRQNGRAATCRACENSTDVRREAQAREERLKKGISRLVAAANQDVVKLPDIGSIPAEMINLFGGVREFVREWKSQIDLSPSGSKTRLDQMYAVFKMLTAAAQERREQEDLKKFSEPELEEAIAGFVFNVVGVDEDEVSDTDAA